MTTSNSSAPTESETVVGHLETLLQASRNALHEYQGAAEIDIEHVHLLMIEKRDRRKNFVVELRQAIFNMGGEPSEPDFPTVGSRIHRLWMELRSSLATNHECALLEECCNLELVTIGIYAEALESEMRFPVGIEHLIREQHDHCVADLAQMRELQTSLKD